MAYEKNLRRMLSASMHIEQVDRLRRFRCPESSISLSWSSANFENCSMATIRTMLGNLVDKSVFLFQSQERSIADASRAEVERSQGARNEQRSSL